MVENTINNLSFCSGVGGLELGLDLAFGNIRTVCHVEGEAYAASILAQKMEEGTLHDAPIWDNVRTFDAKPWRGRVHSISGGFPCQPFSQAGKQLAENDPRHLWPEFTRIIGEVRPKFIFLENVPGVVKLAAPTIFTDLAEMGYSASWCVIKASDVGALHHRARWFCLAWKNSDDADAECLRYGIHQTKKSIHGLDQERKLPRRSSSRCSSNFTNSNGEPLIPPPDRECKETPGLSKNDGDVADSRDERMGSRLARTVQTISEESKGRDHNRTGNVQNAQFEGIEKPQILQRSVSNSNGQRLERKTSNRVQGKRIWPPTTRFDPEWWKVEPRMGRMVDGVADWVDRIRACGNGVVPAQAAEAFTILYEQYEKHSS